MRLNMTTLPVANLEQIAAGKNGIPVLASAHAASLSELRARRGLSDILEGGAFGVFVGIALTDGAYSLTVDGL